MPKVNTSQNNPTNATTLLLDTSAQLRKVGNGNALHIAQVRYFRMVEKYVLNIAISVGVWYATELERLN